MWPAQPRSSPLTAVPSALQREPVLNKVVYFVRANAKGISEKTCEQDITAGIVSKETLDSYKVLLSELYLPIFLEQSSWGKSSEEHTRAFLQVSSRSCHVSGLHCANHASCL